MGSTNKYIEKVASDELKNIHDLDDFMNGLSKPNPEEEALKQKFHKVTASMSETRSQINSTLDEWKRSSEEFNRRYDEIGKTPHVEPQKKPFKFKPYQEVVDAEVIHEPKPATSTSPKSSFFRPNGKLSKLRVGGAIGLGLAGVGALGYGIHKWNEKEASMSNRFLDKVASTLSSSEASKVAMWGSVDPTRQLRMLKERATSEDPDEVQDTINTHTAAGHLGAGVGTVAGLAIGGTPGYLLRRPGLALSGGALGALAGSAYGSYLARKTHLERSEDFR